MSAIPDTFPASNGLHIVPYTPDVTAVWDRFVAASKNGTFIFQRDYLAYFEHFGHFGTEIVDASLLIYDGNDLPACRSGDQFVSHARLTYGGFVISTMMKIEMMRAVFNATCEAHRAWGVRVWDYRAIPTIYHRSPAEEDLFALFASGATLSRRRLLSVVDLRAGIAWQQRRLRGVKKA